MALYSKRQFGFEVNPAIEARKSREIRMGPGFGPALWGACFQVREMKFLWSQSLSIWIKVSFSVSRRIWGQSHSLAEPRVLQTLDLARPSVGMWEPWLSVRPEESLTCNKEQGTPPSGSLEWEQQKCASSSPLSPTLKVTRSWQTLPQHPMTWAQVPSPHPRLTVPSAEPDRPLLTPPLSWLTL